jgi:hypothetical protein
MRLGYCFDIESNGFFFQADKIWTLSLRDLEDPSLKLKLNPFKDPKALDKWKQWHNQYDNPFVVAHYGLGFDVFVSMKLLGLEFAVGKDTMFGKPCVFIDTFYLSQYLNPDNDGHSLEDWGLRVGFEKIDYFAVAKEKGTIPADAKKGDEFLVHSEDMDIYCERDTEVNVKAFWKMWNEFCEAYDVTGKELPAHFKCGQKAHYLMSCQEYSGWKFDRVLGAELQERITKMMLELEAEVLPKLPPRKLKKGEQKEYSMPAKPFKKDGSFSSHMLNFIEKHSGKVNEDGTVGFYGKNYKVEGQAILDVQLPMEIKDSDDLKEWFISNGWKPTFWNYQRGPDGKPMRDEKTRQLIKTTPKIQEAGKICPNLEKLDGELPKKIVKFLSLRNRLSVLTTWMEDPRLEIDGRLSPSRTGIAATHRQKHSKVVNVPKASDKVLLGKEFRSLFICEDEMLIAAGDAAALEGRVQGHYCWKYDEGETARELLAGDVHSKTAKSVFPNELTEFDIAAPDFNKDDPKFKPYRDRSKNVYYAAMYGASPAKLANVAGLPEQRGKEISEAFWAANAATAELKKNVEKFWETKGQKKWLPAIDGRRIMTRKKSALLNTIFQSCGGIIMDYACCFLDMWLGGIKFDKDFKPYYNYKGCTVRRIGYFHDEVEFECDKEVAEEVAKMIEKAITKAGEHLKVQVPLAGEGKVGINWKETH